MENQTTYTTDYRSPPSGLGYISKPNGDLILLRDDCYRDWGTSDLKPGIYSQVIYLENSFEDDWETTNSELIQTLENLEVTVVHDSELSYEMELDGSPMTLAQFKEFRSIW